MASVDNLKFINCSLVELFTENYKTKKDNDPVAVFYYEDNGKPNDISSIGYENETIGACRKRIKPWHYLIQSIGKSHWLDLYKINSRESLDEMNLSCWGKRTIDLYISCHTPRENVFFQKFSKKTLDSIRKIFLISCCSSEIATQIASQTKKEVWAVNSKNQICYPNHSHVMSSTGDMIHFDRLSKNVVSLIYTPDGKTKPIPYTREDIRKDVYRSCEDGNPMSFDQTMGLCDFLPSYMDPQQPSIVEIESKDPC